MNEIYFDQYPSFAELWGVAIRQLCPESAFTEELLTLLRSKGLNEKSSIADVAAGDGFPALSMREKGFTIDCFDLSDDQIKSFKRNARKRKVSSLITQSDWLHVKDKVEKSYDCIMCTGNSFIYAAGGWNSKEYNKDHPLTLYRQTLGIFYELLLPGGILIIDKFKDSERSHEVIVCRVKVKDHSYDLTFSIRTDVDKKERYASITLDDGIKSRETLPNLTYALSEKELSALCHQAGFSGFEKITFKSNKLFDTYIIRK